MERPSEEIREVGERYVQRARSNGEDKVTIVAGDVVRELRLEYRVPSVCSALSSKRFQRENRIVLENREGPPSGVSTTTKYTYRLEEIAPAGEAARSSLWALRGAGKEVFQALGGGEDFLNRERDELDL